MKIKEIVCMVRLKIWNELSYGGFTVISTTDRVKTCAAAGGNILNGVRMRCHGSC